MIQVSVGSDKYGAVWELTARGHAPAETDTGSVPCAAVSVLLRTFAHSCERDRGIDLDGEAARPGDMKIRILSVKRISRKTHRAFSRFLLQGLGETAREYPEQISVDVRVLK